MQRRQAGPIGGTVGILEAIPELVCPACHGALEEQHELHCTSCGAAYPMQDGIPNMLRDNIRELAQEMATQDRVAQEYEQQRYQVPYARRYHRWWDRQMLGRLGTAARVLDNGCGIGTLLEQLPPGSAVGLDLSSEMLSRARGGGAPLILGNSLELPLADASFDAVLCRSLLHHLPDLAGGVREIARVLRPGGTVVFIDTNTSLLSALPRWLANRGEHFSDTHQNLDRRTFARLLAPSFEIAEVLYFGYLAYPLLGFPDLVSLFRLCPFKPAAERLLMACDGVLARLPGIRTQSWAILVHARRRPA